jgi:transposase, IS5 family
VQCFRSVKHRVEPSWHLELAFQQAGVEFQPNFAHSEYAGKKKRTRRDLFLAEMDAVVPWLLLVGLVEPFSPKGKRGRPPVGIGRMLRIYFLQQGYELAAEALEGAIYDSQSMRHFTGIDLGVESVPDATTLLKFRHLLEPHDRTRKIFEQVNALLSEKQLFMRKGPIVDATIIAAAPSTKNKARERDPEMHQTKKGNQDYFGMKANIGVDADTGLVHTLTATAANVSDAVETHKLLHGEEAVVFVDAGHTGGEKRQEVVAQHPGVEFVVAEKRGKIKAMLEGELKDLKKALEKAKTQVRALVEHPFPVIKNLFRHRQVRYRDLAKNLAQLYSLFALANLTLIQRSLLGATRA